MDRRLKKISLFLITIGSIVSVSAQIVLKVGENLTTLNKGTVLEVESTNKGFLLPRMTKVQRDAIVSPPVGLQVWCTDCNTLTSPATGELSIYTGTGWPPLILVTTPKVSTGKKSDPNAPVRVSATSAIINGVLVSTAGIAPTETGIVWKEITGTDFSTLPLLDDNAVATAPIYKTVGTLVNTVGGAIAVTIPSLTSTTSSTRPYYFRTYAKNTSGVGYGNPVIFNCAPPVISTPVVLYQAGPPAFAGTLSINAGTPQGSITEYGYYSGTTNPPNSNGTKIVLSTPTSLKALNATLNSETFTANPIVSLAENNYTVISSGTSYFMYYAINNGVTIYSSVIPFNPISGDPVTGGTAVATMTGIDPISAPLKIGTVSSSTITIHFNVTQAGTFGSFIPIAASGATTGLNMPSVASGNFALGAQSLTFFVNGTPATSLDGNSFAVPRIGSLSTGAIQTGDLTGGNAICDGLHTTAVIPISSSTGKIWMDRNLGASRAAIAVNDYQAYGGLYQWGRGNDGHASMSWTSATVGVGINGTTTTLSATDSPGNNLFILSQGSWQSPNNMGLWQGVSGINNPCPVAYRIPTQAEINAEVSAYNITNAATAYASIHKFVLAGSRGYPFNQETFSSIGTTGLYWTNYSGLIRLFSTSSTSSDVSSPYAVATGMSVRCIKN